MQQSIDFKTILNQLGEIKVKPLLTPSPENLEEQKVLFLQNPKYNPQFTYRAPSEMVEEEKNLDNIRNSIERLDLDELIKTYLYGVADYIYGLIKLNQLRGNDELFGKQLSAIYNWDLEVNTDFDSLELLNIEEENIYSAEDIKNHIETALKEGNINGWKVVLKGDERASIRVNTYTKSINVGLLAKKGEVGLKKLLIHEIDTHVLRMENSLRSDLPILVKGNLPGKILTEEGFAVYNEYKNKVLTKSDLQRYKNRFNLCKDKKTFSQIYNECIENLALNKDQAFETALRLKRGFNDTSNPQTHLKDSAYLKGFDLMLGNIKTKDDYALLFKGRLSLQDKILEDNGLLNANYIYPAWL